MVNLPNEKHNVFWHGYDVVVAAGSSAGIRLNALPPVRSAIGGGFDSKTITFTRYGLYDTGVARDHGPSNPSGTAAIPSDQRYAMRPV